MFISDELFKYDKRLFPLKNTFSYGEWWIGFANNDYAISTEGFFLKKLRDSLRNIVGYI